MNRATPTAPHWDPFGRTVPAQRHRVRPPRPLIRVPPWLTSTLVVLALSGTSWLIGGAVFGQRGAALLPPATLIGLGIGGVLLTDILGKNTLSRLCRYFKAAKGLGWSFRLAPSHVPGAPGLSGHRRHRAPGSGTGSGFMAQALAKAEASRRAEGTISDTAVGELQAVYRTIPELFRPRPGQPVAMTVEAEFWGETRTGVPFWMGVREAEMNTTLAAKELKTDAQGHAGHLGALLTMVVAYRLDRDTGIRAALLAESLGDSRNDLKTESTEFNACFHISLRDNAGSDDGMRLLQVLTPAMQTSLLDLWQRYRVQVIVDGPNVYVAGREPINTRDPAILTQSLGRAAADFAAAVTRFKRYAE